MLGTLLALFLLMTKALRLFWHFIDLLLQKNDNKFINKKLLFVEVPFYPSTTATQKLTLTYHKMIAKQTHQGALLILKYINKPNYLHMSSSALILQNPETCQALLSLL